MTDVKWVKLSTTMFDDEKIKLIEKMPDSDTILVIWVKLLAQAGRTNTNGYIFLSENIPYNDEMLATVFDRPVSTVRMALETFQKFGMVTIDNDSFIRIENWEKHQNVEGLEKIRKQTRKRVAKHRENKNENVTLHVTQSNATEGEEEGERDKRNNQQIDKAFADIWKEYPKKTDKQQAKKKFKKKAKDDGLDIILEGTKKYIQECKQNKTEKQYIKHYATFLNKESYKDDFDDNITKNNEPIPESQRKFDPSYLFES